MKSRPSTSPTSGPRAKRRTLRVRSARRWTRKRPSRNPDAPARLKIIHRMLASMSLALGSLLFGGAAMAAADSAVPIADAAPTHERIVLDGALDEAAWRDAMSIRLTQQDPKPGEPTPYDTRVRVLVDRTHLY